MFLPGLVKIYNFFKNPLSFAPSNAIVCLTKNRELGGTRIMTKNEFFKHGASNTARTCIIASAVIGYVAAALLVLLTQNYIDAVIVLGLALGIHLGKSRVCSILLTVYGALSILIYLIAYGVFQGWLYLPIGILAIVGTFRFHREFKAANASDPAAQSARTYQNDQNAQAYQTYQSYQPAQNTSDDPMPDDSAPDDAASDGPAAEDNQFCRYCGSVLSPTAKFCKNCGAMLDVSR